MSVHRLGDLTMDLEPHRISGEFRISRGAKTIAEVLVVTIERGGVRGAGEAVPYARYEETRESITDQLLVHKEALRHVEDRELLRRALPPGALRNAVDLALWDLAARASGTSSPRVEEARSALTISLAPPETMAARATAARGTLLKLKLAGDGADADRLRAVHAARPDAELWLDANEGLDAERYLALVPLLESLPVVLVEQPFPAGLDAALAVLPRPVPICADESAHGVSTLAALADRYDAVNVKLDKTGGLTEALDVVREARRVGLDVVVGSMVCTSLALAPAFVLAKDADFVDLDGSLFLERDREGGVTLLPTGMLRAPARALWAG